MANTNLKLIQKLILGRKQLLNLFSFLISCDYIFELTKQLNFIVMIIYHMFNTYYEVILKNDKEFPDFKGYLEVNYVFQSIYLLLVGWFILLKIILFCIVIY